MLTIYKILVLGLLWALLPFGVVFGIAALFGADTVKRSDVPIHGVLGLLLGPVVSAGAAVGLGILIATMVCLGLWVQFRFTTMTIRFVPKGGATARHRHDTSSPSADIA